MNKRSIVSAFALACLLSSTGLAQSAFTYQGQLKQNNVPSTNAALPMTFQLFDAETGGSAVGAAVSGNVNVQDGLFTVQLDFPSVTNAFNGQRRWLEITVNGQTLSPRQEITPTPYSLFSMAPWQTSGSNVYYNGGNVGIGTSSPTSKLDVNGDVRLHDTDLFFRAGSDINHGLGWYGTGKPFATLNVDGPALYGYGGGALGTYQNGTTNLALAWNSSGNVGIGSAASGVRLEVNGTTRMSGLTLTGNGAGAGKVLTSDASGNATWQSVSSSGWSLSGNSGVGGGFLGTLDNQPLEFKVNNFRVMRYQFSQETFFQHRSVNTVGGSEVNSIESYLVGATIAGGGRDAFSGADEPNVINNIGDFGTIGGGYGNRVSDRYATVSGGRNNSALTQSSTVGGGQGNSASGEGGTVAGGISNAVTAPGYATVSGGLSNTAAANYSNIGGGRENKTYADYNVIGGGYKNEAGSVNTALYATVAGGGQNKATLIGSTVGGGQSNTASNNNATVIGGLLNTAGGLSSSVLGGEQNSAGGFVSVAAGGYKNSAGGVNSFAAGRNAKANHDGTFVWSDLSGGDFNSTANNSFIIRAASGVGINTNAPGFFTLNVAGTISCTSLTQTSDARFKTNVAPLVDSLNAVLSLRGVTFDWDREVWKDSHFPEGRQIGFIAQEVEKILPELVITNTDGYKSVNYANVVPVLVEAIKTQQAQIDQMKDENAELKAKVREIDQLKAQLAKLMQLLEKNSK